MKQSRIDSAMEAVVNIIIGSAIYTLVNHTVLAYMLGIPISVGMSLWISVMFTIVSFGRTFAIRRLFNGRSVWDAMKQTWCGLQDHGGVTILSSDGYRTAIRCKKCGKEWAESY